MKHLLITLLLFGCTQGDWHFDANGNPIPLSPPVTDNPSESVALRNLVAIDDNGENLGLVLSGSNIALTILSPIGYVYSTYWDGELISSLTYYTTSNCTLTAYLYVGASKVHGKLIHTTSLGQLLTPLSESNGVGTVTSNSMGSQLNSSGVCVFNTASGNFVELTTVSRSSVGIPTNIQGPISVEEN